MSWLYRKKLKTVWKSNVRVVRLTLDLIWKVKIHLGQKMPDPTLCSKNLMTTGTKEALAVRKWTLTLKELVAWLYMQRSKLLPRPVMTALGKSGILTITKTLWLVKDTKIGFQLSISIQRVPIWRLGEVISPSKYGTSLTLQLPIPFRMCTPVQSGSLNFMIPEISSSPVQVMVQ